MDEQDIVAYYDNEGILNNTMETLEAVSELEQLQIADEEVRRFLETCKKA